MSASDPKQTLSAHATHLSKKPWLKRWLRGWGPTSRSLIFLTLDVLVCEAALRAKNSHEPIACAYPWPRPPRPMAHARVRPTSLS